MWDENLKKYIDDLKDPTLSGKPYVLGKGLARPTDGLYLAGTGTGVDGAEGASASRRQTQVTERETSPRHPHHDRALAPETDPPWTALFQSSSKAARVGDEIEGEIVSFNGGWRAPVTVRALTRRHSPDPITDLLSLSS
ncbi:hypothetical protein F2Q68_00032687 [Brassica cretica]|uniref:Uncharacterized protein n=1 Tax=Brassica cretica TaxID=69181 RepID=A0A8S9GEN7_BRACR|nr:hypothetical protein F2Q68_00032687 [Brassica cretica]